MCVHKCGPSGESLIKFPTPKNPKLLFMFTRIHHNDESLSFPQSNSWLPFISYDPVSKVGATTKGDCSMYECVFVCGSLLVSLCMFRCYGTGSNIFLNSSTFRVSILKLQAETKYDFDSRQRAMTVPFPVDSRQEKYKLRDGPRNPNRLNSEVRVLSGSFKVIS